MTKKFFGAATVLGMLLTGGAVFADTTVVVTNVNNATVTNNAEVIANTGKNSANGGTSGSGGSGGAALGGYFGFNMGGDGGASGAGGDGGTISTGDALASSLIVNDVNSNDTTISILSCDCDPVYDETLETWRKEEWSKETASWWKLFGGEDEESEDWSEEDWALWTKTYVPVDTTVIVTNSNSASVSNDADVKANTGKNEAHGGNSGKAGNGGNAESDGGFPFWYKYWDGDYDYSGYGNLGGEGGKSGSAGDGGTITTGDALSVSEMASIVNDNVTRITKE